MALSGSLTSSKYDGCYYVLSWNATQSIADNKSTIKWTLKFAGSSGWIAERTLLVKLAGKTLVDKTDRVERENGTIKTGSFTVTHDASSGEASISGSIKAALYGSSVNVTGSKTWELTKIPRAATISSAPNFNDEDNPTITYSNPAGNSATSLQACIANADGKTIYAAYRDISKTGKNYTFNLTDEERANLRNASANSNNMKVKYYLKTVIGDNTFYNAAERTLSIVNADPVITIANAEDIMEASLAVTLDSQKVIKGFNEIQVHMAADVFKGATVKSYSIKNRNAEISSASGSFVNAESGIFVFSVTDSRDNTTEQTVELSLIDYVKLSCNMNEKAPDAEGNLTFTIEGNCYAGSFGEVDNEARVYLRYAESGGEFCDWIEIETRLYQNHRYTAEVALPGFDYRSKYTLQAKVEDLLDSVESPHKAVKTIPVFDWGENDVNFHVPIHIQGNPLVYITEEGTKDGWDYRKWSNGICECWYCLQHTTTLARAWGTMYLGDITDRIPYPFSFASKPHEQVTLQSANSACWLVTESAGRGVNGTYQTGQYNAARPTAVSSTNTLYYNFYCYGKLLEESQQEEVVE